MPWPTRAAPRTPGRSWTAPTWPRSRWTPRGRGAAGSASRKAPYNVIGDVHTLLARAGTGTTSGDPGFRYGPRSPGGTPVTSVSTSWSASRVTLTWEAGRYAVSTDGHPDVDADGTPHVAGTVVVQEVPSHLGENRDVNGVHTPVLDLVGGGRATYLRDGQGWKGEWSWPDLGAPTTFTAGGQPFAMSGPIWVLLVPAGRRSTSAEAGPIESPRLLCLP